MDTAVEFSNAKHKTQVIARAIACGMLLLVLPSCQIPKLSQAEPGPDLPAGFKGATSSENSAQLGIKDFYNDLILTGLIQQALAGNRELKILEQDVQIARNEILGRSGAYLPFVTAGGGASLQNYSRFTEQGVGIVNDPYFPGKLLPNPTPDYQLGFNLLWQLDIWRQLRNARDAAQQRYLAAIEKRNSFVIRLVADIAENYYGLMALDKRLENLDQIIELQEQSLKSAKVLVENARSTLLAVQRFQAELQKNESQKLIVRQDIIQTENRINFLVNRYPQPVERTSARFFDLDFPLNVGVPAQLLQNRPDIRQAERELAAAGLDVRVARARFFPTLIITGGIGYEAFDPRYLFYTPEALAANVAGNLVAPLINKRAIRADYLSANAKQLQAVYSYQRVILNAFTEVVTRMSMVRNYSKSVEIKKQQVESLKGSVDSAGKLFLNARVTYIDVLFAQRDLWDARAVLIETKQQQLSAVVSTYQALGGGLFLTNEYFIAPETILPIPAPE